jgi:hypothetical protein
VVRHVAGSWAIGDAKVDATQFLIWARAPWTRVTTRENTYWDPDVLRAGIDGLDLVVDATGLSRFAAQLSVLCEEIEMPLVSIALYRGGAVARVRRQGGVGEMPFLDRVDAVRYPVIPPGDEVVHYEPGCSSAVNNASPVAVASAAALAAEVCIDALTGRYLYADEVVDVYRPLDEAPFDRIGRVRRDSSD